ncbi:MAG: hypothetical protein HW406_2 [Candidatus Brocadiaceae bacterium]|nr:hypothetical protein [Candidatus Brocadiaceae bacterium]
MQNSSLNAVLDLWSQTRALHHIPITGRSMLPLIRKGDHVLVVHGCDGVRRGDVVVFRHEGKLIAHRVLHIYKETTGHRTFITKGDNSPQCDPPWSSREMVGRVSGIKRGKKEMSLDTPYWRVVGWHIAFITLVWIKLSGLRRKIKQRLLGTHFNVLITLQRRGLDAFFFSVRKTLLITLFKWKS